MAKEHVEYSLRIVSIEYFVIQNDRLCRMSLCDIDNNWVLLLFTSCTLLTIIVNLVGGMAHVRQTLHKYDGCIRFYILSYYKIVCIEEANIPIASWHVVYVKLAIYLVG